MKNDKRDIFSKRLAMRRKELGLTQEMLANNLDMKKSQIGKLETLSDGAKEGFPLLINAKRIAQELNCSLDWLCGLSDNVAGDNSDFVMPKADTEKAVRFVSKLIDGSYGSADTNTDVDTDTDNTNATDDTKNDVWHVKRNLVEYRCDADGREELGNKWSVCICSDSRPLGRFIFDYEAAINAAEDVVNKHGQPKEVADNIKESAIKRHIESIAQDKESTETDSETISDEAS